VKISTVQSPAEIAQKANQKEAVQVLQVDDDSGLLKTTKEFPTNDMRQVAKDEQTRTREYELLRESEQRYWILFEQSPIGICLATLDRTIIAANNTLQTITGYSKEELKKIKLIDMYEDLNQRMALLEVLNRHGAVTDFPVRLRRKDGTSCNALLNVRMINAEGENLLQTTVQDITERIREKKQLQMMNEKLRVVGTLTRHDVRNKLTAVRGYVVLASRKLERNEQATNDLGEIELVVREIIRIFDFASAYEKLGVEKIEYLDLEKTIEDVVWLFTDLKSVSLINKTHGLIVLADSLLRQLFYNLIDNSLKHGEKTSKIRIHYEIPKEDRCVIVYEDDGVGIPLEAKSRLFEAGFTTDKGSGYGLYLIRKILEVYGWTIREEGAPGKGAKFTITIPRRRLDGPESYKVTAPSIILQGARAKPKGADHK
jgi:PAS domain S-box-containing protein